MRVSTRLCWAFTFVVPPDEEEFADVTIVADSLVAAVCVYEQNFNFGGRETVRIDIRRVHVHNA